MTIAVFCDRCKKLFPLNETHSVNLDLGYNESLEGDLCNECRDSVELEFYGASDSEEKGDSKDE